MSRINTFKHLSCLGLKSSESTNKDDVIAEVADPGPKLVVVIKMSQSAKMSLREMVDGSVKAVDFY